MQKGITTLFLLFFLNNVYSQEAKLISGDFNQSPVLEFVRQMEKQTAYVFYFDAAELDSIRITLTAKNQPLEDVLNAAFKHTDVQFAIDSDGNIFLTRGFKINTSLVQVQHQKNNLPDSTAKNTYSFLEEPETPQKPNSENKVYEIGSKALSSRDGKTVLSGYVRSAKSGEPVMNAAVFLSAGKIVATTDQYGFYSLSLPQGSHTLNVQATGMKDVRFQLTIYSDGKFNIDLSDQVRTLKEVVVSAQKVANVNRLQLGVERLSIATIRQVPVVFGEADVIRVVTTLPGVKTVGEASTGFNVRGGSTDQNLILFNDMTVYNPSHFFGMFSSFNPEIVNDVELYKSSVPAKFGGRLSSVLDISTKQGNKKELHGSAGIGLITSRVNLEGPIVKDKTSFILGGRSTYANWLLKLLPDEYKNSRASFHDVSVSINHKASQKNDLFITGYLSNDRFGLAADTSYGYSNKNVSVKWKHTFSSKLNGTFTSALDHYKYSMSDKANESTAYTLAFDINQLSLKADFSYLNSANHTFDFGVSTLRYKLHPGALHPSGKQSLQVPDIVPAEQALESAVYFSDRYTVTPELSINAGIRYSVFNYLGPKEIQEYGEGLPKDESTMTNVQSYNSGKFIKTYHGPEFRFSVRYILADGLSVKAGYNSMRQYIHMLSNTTVMAPTDIWKLSDPHIKPQRGSQFSFGVYKNLKSNTIETSLEVYYKKIQDYLDYKPGASLILNHHIETDVINTKGKAYGAELMIKKTAGKLNGWISYTYSRILLQTDDPTVSTPVNSGNFYPANYDKPHDITLIGNFRINHRFSLSLNSTYSTGRPITVPIGRYYYAGSQRVLYSDRNAYRIPDYFRTDFSMNIDGNHKVNQRTHNSWTIGVYNLLGRKNPYSVYFLSENGVVNGYKLSIFGSAIPFVNFNIKF